MPTSASTVSARRRLDEIIRSVHRLRPLPTSATRILKELDDPHATARSVAELIALDQALTAYVLKVANSAAMGYLIACASVQEAVVRLGFKQIRSLVYSTLAAGPLSARLSGYRLGDQGLWNHSVAVASTAHWLATALHYPDPEKAYVGGLLHDIGKLVLDQYVMADYNQIMNIMRTNRLPMWQVEEQLFGIDHAGVGGLVATHWQFPTELTEAIRYHHSPQADLPDQRLAALVNLANALAPEEHIEDPVLAGKIVHPVTMEILKLTPENIAPLAERVKEGLLVYQDRLQLP
ncbi:MAG: HDOD domain-containing protein [Anaerolineales bacterium]